MSEDADDTDPLLPTPVSVATARADIVATVGKVDGEVPDAVYKLTGSCSRPADVWLFGCALLTPKRPPENVAGSLCSAFADPILLAEAPPTVPEVPEVCGTVRSPIFVPACCEDAG